MRVAITGGGGYVGSQLVPHLLDRGHSVTVLDTFWFGNHLPWSPRLRSITGDIRDRTDRKNAFRDQDAVIHLACVSNDPSFDMNPDLGKSINHDCFTDLLTTLQEQHVGRFIYASSSSVYGVSELKDVTEDSPKWPLTDYSKFKLACEKDLENYGMGGVWTILRPATVCGYSPRQRLDLVVNILATQAIVNKKITLFGRDQKRPNINIRDMVRAYEFILSADERVVDQKIFNVGFENLSLRQIAEIVKVAVGDPSVEIVEEETNDPRSYHVNSDLIEAAGFRPLWSIQSAVRGIKEAIKNRNLSDPLNNPEYYNIRKMKELGL